MDTEAIASEIVDLRNRLDELNDQVEKGDAEVNEERVRLMDRLRHLQDQLSSDEPTDEPAMPEHVRYLPPA